MLRNIFWGVVFLSITISVGWMIAICVKDISNAHAAKNWPTTMGVVVSSEVKRPRNGKSYVLKILYRYSVGSKTYMGNRLTFGFVLAGSGSKNAAQELVNQYPVNLPVPVHFNPVLPSDAVILTQVSNETWWFVFTMPFASIVLTFMHM